MKQLNAIERYVKSTAQKNVTKGKVTSVDFDRAVVVPVGSTGSIRGAYIVGDPNTISVGQEVDLVFGEGRVLVMANAERSAKEYSLEDHAERHAENGTDPITLDMLGAAKKIHTHTGDEIVGGIDPDTIMRSTIAEIGATSDGTDVTTYAFENGWYNVGPNTAGMPSDGSWWYVEAYVTTGDNVLLRAHGVNGAVEDVTYSRRKESGIWNPDWVPTIDPGLNQYNTSGGIQELASLGNNPAPADTDLVLVETPNFMGGGSSYSEKTTWAQVKSTLKTYFDTLYNKYVHPNHSGDVTSVADGATTIGAQKVTVAKMYSSTTSRIFGRISAGAGAGEELTQANVRTIIGAGSGNGLDADTLDTYHAASFVRFTQRQGTSFPGSPSAGDPFFRTDLGWQCYWNGTYWLTAHDYTTKNDQPWSISANTTGLVGIVRSDYAAYVTAVEFQANFASIQGAVNYWTFTPRMVDIAYSTSLHLGTWTSDTVSTGVGTRNFITVTSHTHATNRYWLDINFAKTNSPGNITQLFFVITYKLIVT